MGRTKKGPQTSASVSSNSLHWTSARPQREYIQEFDVHDFDDFVFSVVIRWYVSLFQTYENSRKLTLESSAFVVAGCFLVFVAKEEQPVNKGSKAMKSQRKKNSQAICQSHCCGPCMCAWQHEAFCRCKFLLTFEGESYIS